MSDSNQKAIEEEAKRKAKEKEFLDGLLEKYPGLPSAWPLPKPREEQK